MVLSRVVDVDGPVAGRGRRLVALKDKYDPANMFRLNANIRPSATVTGPDV